MKPNDTYQTIATPVKGVFKEKGSKFISLAFPVKSEDEIKEHLNSLKKEYHDARHHCYAYCLGIDKAKYRFNDDGEPSGTAGRPIYGQILSRDLTDILVVVIRYFGGIKLGVSGLINAYKYASKDALDKAEITMKKVTEEYVVQFSYSMMNRVMKILKEENATITRQGFEKECIIHFTIRKSSEKKIVSRLKMISNVSVDLLKEF